MLTEQDFIKIEKQAIGIYQNLELQIIEEIATRIANFGYANTVVLNDIQIAQEAKMLPIKKIAEKLNLNEDDIEYYGKYKCKL